MLLVYIILINEKGIDWLQDVTFHNYSADREPKEPQEVYIMLFICLFVTLQ